MKQRNGFLYVQNLTKQWRLVPTSLLDVEGKKLLEIAIVQVHAVTAHGGMQKTKKAISDKFEHMFFACLVRENIGSGEICQSIKWLQKGPIGYVIQLQEPVRQ